MKKKLIAVFAATCMCLACLPLLSGCKANTDYTLKTDEDGEKYYSVRCSGFTASLKGECIIPSEYGEGENRAPVKEIEAEGFANTAYSKIVVPNTVTRIGNAAFAYNNQLTEIVYEDGIELEQINRGMFGYCLALGRVDIPSGVKSIGYMSFYGCASLTDVTMCEGLETVGAYAFETCTALESISLPETLITIGEGAFANCTSLKGIIIPDSVRDITLTLPGENGETVTQTTGGLGVGAFYGCTSLECAVVGAGITTIPSGAFGYCTALKEIYLSASLEGIEGAKYVNGSFYSGHAFHSDSALTDVYYAGTEEEWAALVPNISANSVTESKIVYDNSALFNALRHYGASYPKS